MAVIPRTESGRARLPTNLPSSLRLRASQRSLHYHLYRHRAGHLDRVRAPASQFSSDSESPSPSVSTEHQPPGDLVVVSRGVVVSFATAPLCRSPASRRAARRAATPRSSAHPPVTVRHNATCRPHQTTSTTAAIEHLPSGRTIISYIIRLRRRSPSVPAPALPGPSGAAWPAAASASSRRRVGVSPPTAAALGDRAGPPTLTDAPPAVGAASARRSVADVRLPGDGGRHRSSALTDGPGADTDRPADHRRPVETDDSAGHRPPTQSPASSPVTPSEALNMAYM